VSDGSIGWERLRRLRAVFLDGAADAADYWSDTALLDDYDRTFGARIRWKWEFVLDELAQLGWRAPAGLVLDWGCGTGVASRALFAADSTAPADAPARLWDRSPAAMRFAAARLAAENPRLDVTHGETPRGEIGTLLVSHVTSELSHEALVALVELARRATAVLWVEPGTPAASRALIGAREALRGVLDPVAPCSHAAPCPLADGAGPSARDWCHQFASPPPEAFTSAHWARFARELTIDLRSLPVTFLALDRRPHAPLPPDATRLIGRPRVLKGHVRVTGCDGSGVHERRISKRVSPELFRDADCNRVPSLARWRVTADSLIATERVDPVGQR